MDLRTWDANAGNNSGKSIELPVKYRAATCSQDRLSETMFGKCPDRSRAESAEATTHTLLAFLLDMVVKICIHLP